MVAALQASPQALPGSPVEPAQRVSLQEPARSPSTSHFLAFHQVPAPFSRKWAKGKGGSEGGVWPLASLTSTWHPWGRWDHTWPLLPVQPHPGPSGDCPEAQTPSLTEPDHFLSPPCVSEPQWKLVKTKQKKHTPPCNFHSTSPQGILMPYQVCKSAVQGTSLILQVGTLRLECPGSHGTRGCLTPSPGPCPQCLAPRGLPCKHCPHFRMSLKLPSSTVFAGGHR